MSKWEPLSVQSSVVKCVIERLGYAFAAVAIATLCLSAAAEDNTVTLCDRGVRNIPSRLVVGWTGTNNALIVTGGAGILSLTGEIGLGGSFNQALITGQGSVWSNQCPFKVGGAGAWNQLIVAGGGLLVNRTLGVIGDNNGIPGNRIVVTDPGSAWQNDGGVTVGWGGAFSSLVVSNGGSVWNTHAVIGRDSAAVSNWVAVSGAGSVWQNAGVLLLGPSGSASRLSIRDRGAVAAASLSVRSPRSSIEISGGYLFLTNSPAPTAADPTLMGTASSSVAPGHSLRLGPSTTLSFELAPSHDGDTQPFIVVGGTAALNGELAVRLAPGFAPSRDSVFTLMKYAETRGAFRNVSSSGRVAISDQPGSFRLLVGETLMQLTDFQEGPQAIPDSRAVSASSERVPAAPGSAGGQKATPVVVGGPGAGPDLELSLPSLRCVVRDDALGLEFPWSANRVHRLWVSTNLQSWTEVAAPIIEFPAPGVGRWRVQPAPHDRGSGNIYLFRLSVGAQ